MQRIGSNPGDFPRDIVLIGASTGGIAALAGLLSELPADLRAAVGITQHRSPTHRSLLAQVLGARSRLEVREAIHGEVFHPGKVYVAPADHHLTFAGRLVVLDRGPRVHYVRPAIDVMFESGAKNFGARAIGVVLTGNLRDGVDGLRAIKRCGGLSLAQEPAEAVAPSMPLNAVVHDNVDVIFRLAAASEVIAKLVAREGVSSALQTKGTRRPKVDATDEVEPR